MEENLKDKLDTSGLDLRTYSPLTFAFIGDSVYDLIIRTLVVKEANTSNGVLHKKTAALVKAPAQAAMMKEILPLLTEEEQRLYKRGRNAKMATMARNATAAEYKQATGFETLIGCLYLKGSYDRMLTLIEAGLEAYQIQKGGKKTEDGKKSTDGNRETDI